MDDAWMADIRTDKHKFESTNPAEKVLSSLKNTSEFFFCLSTGQPFRFTAKYSVSTLTGFGGGGPTTQRTSTCS